MDNTFLTDGRYTLLFQELNDFHARDGAWYQWEKGDTMIIYDALLRSLARYLAKYKEKEKRVALVINDNNDNFIMGMAIDYENAENEEDEMPGNWEVFASFDSDKILDEPNKTVYKLQDASFLAAICQLMQIREGFVITPESCQQLLIIYYGALAETIKQGSNNDTGKPYSLPIGEMTASGQVEDGKVVTAIELSGTIKAIAKDDTSLETINA